MLIETYHVEEGHATHGGDAPAVVANASLGRFACTRSIGTGYRPSNPSSTICIYTHARSWPFLPPSFFAAATFLASAIVEILEEQTSVTCHLGAQIRISSMNFAREPLRLKQRLNYRGARGEPPRAQSQRRFSTSKSQKMPAAHSHHHFLPAGHLLHGGLAI